MKQSVFKGAGLGVSAWLVYGIIEFLLAYAIPKLRTPSLAVAEWQWPLIGSIFGIYILSGLLLGAACGALLAFSGRHHRAENHQIFASLTLAIAFAANLAVRPWMLSWPEKLDIVSALMAATLFVAGLLSDDWRRRAAFLANPGLLTLLLLAGSWLNHDAFRLHSPAVESGVWLFATAAIVAMTLAWRRWGPRNLISAHWKIAAGVGFAAVLWMVVEVSATASVSSGHLPAVGTSAKPDVVLITMDTVRADHLSVYGYQRDTSPNLRAFAREATVYERAISAADYTLPSHASIFTGMYASWHGAYPVLPEFPGGRPLAPAAVTLAETLRSHGYATAGTFANAHFLGSDMGLGQGFDIWTTNSPVSLTDQQHPFYLREGARKVLSLVADTDAFSAVFLRASDINSRAFAILDKVRNRGPFFLFLNYMDAHAPYISRPPFSHQFPGGDPNFSLVSGHRALKQAVNSGKRHITESERATLTARYDGGIAYIDSEIGKVLGRLRELGLYDSALIIIAGDHGESFGDHDRIEHAVTSVFQDQVHVPLLVKYPRQREPQRSAAWVSHVDVMPTVLDVAGCPVPAGVQGRSLRSPRDPDSDVVFAAAREFGTDHFSPRLRGIRRAMLMGSFKLITWSGGAPELYDLAADPAESKNQFRPDDPRAQALLARMTAWTATIPKPAPHSNRPPDPAMLERLKSIGYIQ